IFFPVLQDFLVELLRGGEIGADRFLDDATLPSAVVLKAGVVERVAANTEELRSHREVEEDVASGLVLRIELRDLFLHLAKIAGVDVGRDEVNAAQELV